MRILPNRQHGACLLELLLAAAIILGIAAFIVAFGMRAWRAIEHLLRNRDQDMERAADPEEKPTEISFYRHTGGWTV
jgi:type IV secretory pathway TrbD component